MNKDITLKTCYRTPIINIDEIEKHDVLTVSDNGSIEGNELADNYYDLIQSIIEG